MRAKQHQWFLRTLERKNELYCRVDLWGFVSVMVALLVVLMVGTTSFHDLPTNTVDLSVSQHATLMPGALREDALRIYIKRDGRVFFGYLHVSGNELPDLIREALRNGAENKVYIAADARAKYGDVLKVLDEARLAGVEKVSFLTRQRQ